MKTNKIFSDFFGFCWIILNFIILEFKNVPIWIQRLVHNFAFFQIYSDIFGYFAIFPHILRFIEILLDLSGYIYLCWHKTRAKGNFVQWITLYKCIIIWPVDIILPPCTSDACTSYSRNNELGPAWLWGNPLDKINLDFDIDIKRP